MRIAIVDDGVSLDLCRNKSFVVEENKVVPVDVSFSPKSSHGTSCAQIVCSNNPNHEIYSISICKGNVYGPEKYLETSLNWCMEHRIDIVNLSLGEVGFFDNNRINDLCYKLYANGTYIVAAVSNSGLFTSPAHLPYVIGVDSIWGRLTNFGAWIKSDICRRGLHHLPNHLLPYSCNSFACAQAVRNFSRCSSKMKIKELLFKESRYSNMFIADFTMLKNLYVLDFGDNWHLDGSSHIFKHYNEAIDYFYSKPDVDCISLAVLPGCATSDVMSIIQKITRRLFLLIWCYKITPNEVSNFCRHNYIRLWDERSQPNNILCKGKNTLLDIDIPIITVPELQSALSLAFDLKTYFEMNGYHILVFSPIKRCYLNGAFYFSEINTIKKITDELNPDIVIIQKDNANELGRKIRSDIDCVYCGANSADSCYGKRILIPSDSKMLYERIVTYL